MHKIIFALPQEGTSPLGYSHYFKLLISNLYLLPNRVNKRKQFIFYLPANESYCSIMFLFEFGDVSSFFLFHLDVHDINNVGGNSGYSDVIQIITSPLHSFIGIRTRPNFITGCAVIPYRLHIFQGNALSFKRLPPVIFTHYQTPFINKKSVRSYGTELVRNVFIHSSNNRGNCNYGHHPDDHPDQGQNRSELVGYQRS